MVIRTLQPDPPDGKTKSLFITSENEEDKLFIDSLIETIHLYVEKKGWQKLPRNEINR